MPEPGFETFRHYGIAFRYPADWEITQELGGDCREISAVSPQTPFISVHLLYDQPAPEKAVASAVEAFEETYDEIDVYPAVDRLCERPTAARDVEFVCLELINYAWIRSFETDAFTVLVLYQTTDVDRERDRALFDEFLASLTIDDDTKADE